MRGLAMAAVTECEHTTPFRFFVYDYLNRSDTG